MGLNIDFMIHTFWLCVKAIPMTLNITFVTLLISLPFGFLFGWASYKKVPVFKQIFQVYVSFLRGVPFILIIFLVYTYLPGLIAKIVASSGSDFDVYAIPNILYVYVVFSLNQSAALAAVFKSALETVPFGQMEAALSIGLSPAQAYKRIILPQAMTAAIPVLCSSTTDLIKSTSLAFAMSVADITAVAKVEGASTLSFVEAYIDIFVIYIIVIVIIESLFKLVEKHAKAYKNAGSVQEKGA